MTNANAIADVNAVVNTNDVNATLVNTNVNQLDEYGRDASERTVELSPRDAESIDREVTSGKHDTYDDALSYVIERGLAEIERTRKAARAAAEKTLLKTKKDSWTKMFEQNPALVTNLDIVNTMLADLGMVKK
jgi:hypothetical protein